jgi:4-hydroxyphenylpyruvate dioxygenase-like putative hemolysin
MSKPLLGNNRLNQLAFVVNDIDAATEAFGKLLGIPKPEWFLTASHEISHVVFRGRSSDAQSKLVFIDTPSVQIELIEPNEKPSTMREFLDTVGEGIHHIAFDVDDIQEKQQTMKKHGFPVLQTGDFTSSNGRYSYVDTIDSYKTLVELLERDEPQLIKPVEPLFEPLLGTNKVTQLAIVVKNLDKAAEAYCTLLGVEKPNIVPSGASDITQIVYKGQRTEAKARFMFIQTPLIELELIEPTDSPSAWKEHLETKGEGIHHISFVVNNLDDKVKLMDKLGYPLIQKGNFWNRKGKYAYIDTTSTYKVVIELLEKF